MASTDLVINIIGNAKSAVDALENFGSKASETASKWDAAKVGISLASVAAVAAVGKFASDSIEAYSGAEDQQAQLTAAYQKFPAIADVNIEALRELNAQVQAKTGYHDDAFAAAQATLAQFGLTGEQIEKLTPLMADYAAKTGKDLPTAAEDLGKAMLGQGKALKAVGINFQDTHDKGKNFDQLLSGLDSKVGGFATTMGETASGKARILNTEFENLQETVGGMLLPALAGITDVGVKVTTWLSNNPALVQGLAIAAGVFTVALVALNVAIWASTTAFWAQTAALLANPITWIVLAVVALVAAIVLLALNWDSVTKWITEVWSGFIGWITGVIDGFVGWWNGIWTAVGNWITDAWNYIVGGVRFWLQVLILSIQLIGAAISTWWNGLWSGIAQFVSNVWNNGIVGPIRAAWEWVQTAISAGLGVIRDVWSNVWNGLTDIVKGVWNGVLGFIEDGVNAAIRLINGMISAVNNVGGGFGVHIGLIPEVHIPRLATGTVTNGPMVALIGDNPGGREVVQPVSTYQDELRRAYTAGQSSNAPGSSGPLELSDRSLRALAAIVIDGVNRGGTKAIFDSL